MLTIPPTSSDRHFLTGGWLMTITAPNAVAVPSGLSDALDWFDASVPGTAAAALRDAGRFDPLAPDALHDRDIWYVRDVDNIGTGEKTLNLAGLATIAEVFWNGAQVLDSANMFLCHDINVTAEPRNRLAICFRALAPLLDQKGPRARWRPQLATSQGLRLVRTTLLGHMPGWCPDVHAVGPYRPITLFDSNIVRLEDVRIQADLAPDGSGQLTVSCRVGTSADTPILLCAGASADMVQALDGTWSGHLSLPGIAPWMPHTHGAPDLHEVFIGLGNAEYSLGSTGFRRLEIDCDADGNGFGLVVNGVPVFCRGAVWTNADLTGLGSDRETYRPLLELARDAGMNMLRIGGTMLYESRAFFDLCDEFGILVWQDFQFANYDYPVKDGAFVESVRTEARQQLSKLQGAPSLAVLCGGSEIYQQAAMMGLPESRWKGPLCEEILAECSHALRPDVPYVANSPMGGALPFSPNSGIAHYYGVGAYQRPPDDARRANLRFASECLAFSNVPSAETLSSDLPVNPGHDPRWKAGVPRDRGAGWDFEDIRDFYLRTLYALDPAALRYSDPDRYLDLSRAVTGDVMEATFAEWRRTGSSCRGGLVWTLQDVRPGAGWGVIDSGGRPKPAYYALKRAFRPVNVMLTDEGTNGLAVHVLNDTAELREVKVTLACLRDGKTPVVSGQRDFCPSPHSAITLAATDLFGAFFDTTYAYRFGPPSHDVTIARLVDAETGDVIADAFHFPRGYPTATAQAEIEANIENVDGDAWMLRLQSNRFAQAVHLQAVGFSVSDNWFHLAPGAEKQVTLNRKPQSDTEAAPTVCISALNGPVVTRYSAA